MTQPNPQTHLQALTTALTQGRLLILWAATPWPPLTRLPANRAIAITQRQRQAPHLPPIAWPLSALPPLPILNLDPTNRLAAALRATGASPHLVRGRRDVRIAGRHNLLQLGGDLDTRRGLLLTWDDVVALRTEPDKAYLLRLAARACEGGALLAMAPGEGTAFQRTWETAIAPALGDTRAFGLGAGPWPPAIVPLRASPGDLLARLETVSPPPPERPINTQALRALLMAAFNDGELTDLCFDHFDPVYQEFTTGMTKSQKIQHILTHCARHLETEKLLILIQRRRPAQYAKFQDRLR